jgi:L-lactate dehydrogenase complex protein LldE
MVEVKESETGCGFGGSFAVKFEGISAAMAEQKVRNALDLNADYIISTDSSCLLQLQSYIDKHKLPIQTMHLVDVLTTGWGNI